MNAKHDAILQDWQANAARREDAHFRFLRSLKLVPDPERIDAAAQKLHAEAFAQIDCMRCAHCCRTMDVIVSDQDIDRIAAHLGLSRDAFIGTYLEMNPEEGAYQVKAKPCSFLGTDGRCTIYEVRPDACREFPHTDKEDFTSRTYLHTANTLTCPAVYYLVKQLPKRLRQGKRDAGR